MEWPIISKATQGSVGFQVRCRLRGGKAAMRGHAHPLPKEAVGSLGVVAHRIFGSPDVFRLASSLFQRTAALQAVSSGHCAWRYLMQALITRSVGGSCPKVCMYGVLDRQESALQCCSHQGHRFPMPACLPVYLAQLNNDPKRTGPARSYFRTECTTAILLIVSSVTTSA